MEAKKYIDFLEKSINMRDRYIEKEQIKTRELEEIIESQKLNIAWLENKIKRLSKQRRDFMLIKIKGTNEIIHLDFDKHLFFHMELNDDYKYEEITIWEMEKIHYLELVKIAEENKKEKLAERKRFVELAKELVEAFPPKKESENE